MANNFKIFIESSLKMNVFFKCFQAMCTEYFNKICVDYALAH